MRRIEFLKNLSFTALLVAGIRNEIEAVSVPTHTSSLKKPPESISPYPMNVAEEITSSIISKIDKVGMELDFFLDMFAKELQTLYPFENNSKISNYRELYLASARSEVVFQLTILLVKVWQNLCLQYGLDGYDKKQLAIDSIQIQNAIIRFGKKFKVGEVDPFVIEDSNKSFPMRSSITCSVLWFGSQKKESIVSDTLAINVIKIGKEIKDLEGSSEYNQSFVSQLLAFTNQILFDLDSLRARWHQYSVRFYYLDFAQTKFENQQKMLSNADDRNKADISFLIQSLSLESAIRTIKERAFHMQSGVYHNLDRQNQQMVVSTLVQIVDQISNATRGKIDVIKRLRLVNQYGGIITVSTAAMATDSLPVLEEAILLLQKERKLHFP
ncbi:hypothetical protein ND861_12875 [Leptospira sp. 2 VSF19]|uniref:Uncharacterized protein n=1 Tax=Leptospira soteropolitanensis TaxID=2950025 RepID=A0AAW5VLV5_9LEPT|nr:hypothetical protein [Leptospira soteropolitanensis]MCW7493535.1 hypothetical protein [Leptospira soteropolitanensis]MCW7500933.1 hypothetical protein [Leptospira soteropolitanensis]MCW7523387.1 hypothetical protein [Leptospira soteropolitanensis]MCW7527248.1 hypothetical protein [Leptospira soteropolitanensis]MCW7531105.1 hypothetical protein [Leptospira soteropolitanensis]